MTINDSSGNVGIGTVNPTEKLMVAGNITASSDGNITASTNSRVCWDGETCSRYTYYNGTCVITVGATSNLEVC